MAESNVLALSKSHQSQAGAGTLLALIVGNLLVWLIALAAIAFACFGLPDFALTLE